MMGWPGLIGMIREAHFLYKDSISSGVVMIHLGAALQLCLECTSIFSSIH